MIKNVILMWDRFWWHGNRWRRCARLEWMKRRCAQSWMPRCTPVTGTRRTGGALSDEELLTGFIRKAPAYEAQIRNFWEHVNRAIYPFPYVGEWMRTLKDKGYRLYILSNYGAWTYAKTKDQSLGFLKDVDGALFSFEVKQIKPEPEIYHSLLERFHLRAEEARVPRRQTEQCGRCHRLRHLCHSFYRLRGCQTEIKKNTV